MGIRIDRRVGLYISYPDPLRYFLSNLGSPLQVSKYSRLEETECTMIANGVGRKGRQLLGYKWLPPLTSSSEEASPRSRFKHAACTVGPYLYVFGGKDHHTPLADIWRYHLVLQTWEEVALRGTKIPHLQGHSATAYKRLVLLFGGELSDPASGESPLWIFNTDLHHLWRCWQEQDALVPQGRRDHSAVVYGNKLYVYGGYIDLKGSSSEFWAFNIDEEEWELVPALDGGAALPGSRHGHSAVVYHKAMWVLGGMTNLQPRHDLCRYMFALKKWHHIKCIGSPPPLTGHTALVYKDSMLVIGGESQGTKLNDVWILSFENCQWQQVSIGGEHCLPPCVKHASIVVSPEEDTSPDSDTKDRSLSVPAFGTQQGSSASVEGRPQTSPAVLGDGNVGSGKLKRSQSRSSTNPRGSSLYLTNKIHPQAIEMDVFSLSSPRQQASSPSKRAVTPSPDGFKASSGNPSGAAYNVLVLGDKEEELDVTGSSEFLLSCQPDAEPVAQDNIEMLQMMELHSVNGIDSAGPAVLDNQFHSDGSERNSSGITSQDGRMINNEADACTMTEDQKFWSMLGQETAGFERRSSRQKYHVSGNVTLCASQGWARSSRRSPVDESVKTPTEDDGVRSLQGRSAVAKPQSLDLTCAARVLGGANQKPQDPHSLHGDSPCFCCSKKEVESPSRLCMVPQGGDNTSPGETGSTAGGRTREKSQNWETSSHHHHPTAQLASSGPPELTCHEADACFLCHGDFNSQVPCSLGGPAEDLDPSGQSEGRWVSSTAAPGKTEDGLTSVPTTASHQDLLLEDLEWIDPHGGTDRVHLFSPGSLPAERVTRSTTFGTFEQGSIHDLQGNLAEGADGVSSESPGGLQKFPQSDEELTSPTDMGSAGQAGENQHGNLSGCESSVMSGVLDTLRLRTGDVLSQVSCLHNCESSCPCQEGHCLLPNQTSSPSAGRLKRELVFYNTMFSESLSCCSDSSMSSTHARGSSPRAPSPAEPSAQNVRLYEKNRAGSRRQISSRRNPNPSSGQSVAPRSNSKWGFQLAAALEQAREQQQQEQQQHVERMEEEVPYVLVVGGQISFSASLQRQPLALWRLDLP